MTRLGATVAALLAVGATAAGVAGASSSEPPQRTALVVDASLARDGRELVDPRLEDIRAEVRLPRTAEEASTNVRYFAKLGYRLVVAGPRSSAAAEASGAPTEAAAGLSGALSAASR
jgi:hypothetical protein